MLRDKHMLEFSEKVISNSNLIINEFVLAMIQDAKL